MPKIVFIAEQDIIEGIIREAGELCTVPDGYVNIKRVVKDIKDLRKETSLKIKAAKDKKEKDKDKDKDKVK